METEERLHCCCFTGHRPEKLSLSETEVKPLLEKAIDIAIENGFTTFITGMASGVDIWWLKLCLKRKNIIRRYVQRILWIIQNAKELKWLTCRIYLYTENNSYIDFCRLWLNKIKAQKVFFLSAYINSVIKVFNFCHDFVNDVLD